MKKETIKKVTWTISPFPLTLKNTITGIAKMENRNVPDLVSEILSDWIKRWNYEGIKEDKNESRIR